MNVIRNNRGISLIEVVVAAAISVMLTSVATMAFSMAMSVFVRSARLIEAETEMLSAMYAVKSTFAQASNVVYGGDTNTSMAGTAPNGYNTRDSTSAPDVTLGKIFTTTFNNVTTTAAPNTYLVALMVREMNTGMSVSGSTLTDAPNSKFYGTGVYFKLPAFEYSGGLFIDQVNNGGSGSPNPGGWVKTSPVNATLMFSRLTEFFITDVNVINPDTSISTVGTFNDDHSVYAFTDSAATRAGFVGRTVISANVRLVMRYFTTGQAPNSTHSIMGDYRWCPRPQMYQTATGTAASTPGCDPTHRAGYADIEKKIKVVFTNNSYDRKKYLVERPLGQIYFFKSWAPTSRKGL
jgi:Tfp pilus assembly protein PilE